MLIKRCVAKAASLTFLHPLAVAIICVEEIGLGVRSTICALLHDTVEDTDITLEDIEREFGSEIARIVDGLQKFPMLLMSMHQNRQRISKKFSYSY